MTIRALHVASELYPLLKTGGLADVAGALPPALIERGADVRVLLPGFPAVVAGLTDLRPVAQLGRRFDAPGVTLEQGTLPSNGLVVYVIRAAALYDRPGNPYLNDEHVPYGDNAQRFALLGWVAAQLAQQLDPAWSPQIVHAHDWHAGLAPAYLKAAERQHGRRFARSVFTVHNLAYQGVFPAHQFGQLGAAGRFFQRARHRVLRAAVVSQGGPLLQRPHHHRQPDLCARNPDARPGRRARRPAAPALARSERHPERRRLHGLESRHRHAAREPLQRDAPRRQSWRARKRCKSASASRRKAMRCCSAW